MSTKERVTQDGIDASCLPDDASRFGIDGDGATHFYSASEDTMFVLEGDDVERIDLEGTPMRDPYAWARHVYERRGAWLDLRDDVHPPSVVEPLKEGVVERYGGGA